MNGAQKEWFAHQFANSTSIVSGHVWNIVARNMSTTDTQQPGSDGSTHSHCAQLRGLWPWPDHLYGFTVCSVSNADLKMACDIC